MLIESAEILLYCFDGVIQNMDKFSKEQITLIVFIAAQIELYKMSLALYEKLWFALESQIHTKFDTFTLNQQKSLFYSFGKTCFVSEELINVYKRLLDLEALQSLSSTSKQ